MFSCKKWRNRRIFLTSEPDTQSAFTMPLFPETRHSLLARLAVPADATAWIEFVNVYEDAIYRFTRGRGLQDADARDVVQRVLVAVHDAIAEWKPNGHVGAFRTWLVKTAHRHCMRVLSDNARQDRGIGGTSVLHRLQGLSEGRSSESDDSEWQRWALCWAAGEVQREVEPVTWRSFYLTAVEGVSPIEAAGLLNVRIGSVYAAKCRVLSRIRHRVAELSENEP
jgi:RNA polymerase sigma-70 factor, ECF subfamily